MITDVDLLQDSIEKAVNENTELKNKVEKLQVIGIDEIVDQIQGHCEESNRGKKSSGRIFSKNCKMSCIFNVNQ